MRRIHATACDDDGTGVDVDVDVDVNDHERIRPAGDEQARVMRDTQRSRDRGDRRVAPVLHRFGLEPAGRRLTASGR